MDKYDKLQKSGVTYGRAKRKRMVVKHSGFRSITPAYANIFSFYKRSNHAYCFLTVKINRENLRKEACKCSQLYPIN